MNLGDLRLYDFEAGRQARTYPIGIAKDGYATPLGVTTVKAKREKPAWIPGPSARADDPKLPARVKPGLTTRSANTRSTWAGKAI